MNVSIVGAGYVGLVSGACLADLGHRVSLIDADATKVDAINRGIAPIHEPGLDELLKRNIGQRLHATTDLRAAITETDLTLLAVGTPSTAGEIELSYIRQAAEQIGAALRTKSGYHVVAVKSTIVPRTTDSVVRPILEQTSGKQAGDDFGVGMNPEFLTEGQAVADFLQPDRIVLGGIDERTIETLAELYAVLPNAEIIRTNCGTAEMIKYASNVLLATTISLSNELANLCSTLGNIDAMDVVRGVHRSHYFSPFTNDRDRITAPLAAFFSPGCGYGGSCLPKDIEALVAHGKKHGVNMPLLSAAMETNANQPEQVVELAKRHFPSLKNLRCSVLGLAFKPNTDDVRNSPAVPIIRRLAEEGAAVCAYDPIVNGQFASLLPGTPLQFSADLSAAVHDCDIVIIVTRWPQFEQVPELIRELKNPPLVIDGRRMLSPHSVPRYEGIGLRA
jgi:UDPglucose 6-dehydrogenase